MQYVRQICEVGKLTTSIDNERRLEMALPLHSLSVIDFSTVSSIIWENTNLQKNNVNKKSKGSQV